MTSRKFSLQRNFVDEYTFEGRIQRCEMRRRSLRNSRIARAVQSRHDRLKKH